MTNNMADNNNDTTSTNTVEMEASGRLADSWVDVAQGDEQKKESVGESREEDEVERLLAEATSGEESDVQMTPNVSSAELKSMPATEMSLTGKSQLSGSTLMGASHQSSRAASPPKEFELASGRHTPLDAGRAGSLGHGPMLRSLCVFIPVVICSHLAFFALGYLIGRRTATATRL